MLWSQIILPLRRGIASISSIQTSLLFAPECCRPALVQQRRLSFVWIALRPGPATPKSPWWGHLFRPAVTHRSPLVSIAGSSLRRPGIHDCSEVFGALCEGFSVRVVQMAYEKFGASDYQGCDK